MSYRSKIRGGSFWLYRISWYNFAQKDLRGMLHEAKDTEICLLFIREMPETREVFWESRVAPSLCHSTTSRKTKVASHYIGEGLHKILIYICAGEKARINAAGGFVDFGRVNGNLALSRAIGDFEFKKSAELSPEQQIVTAFPDVTVHDITDDDEFLVVACDGQWPTTSHRTKRLT